MNNFTKILAASSIILGAALFSIGCGEDTKCCSGNDVKANLNLLSSVNNGNLPLNVHKINVNGLGSSSDGTITKAVWTVYADCTKDLAIDTKSVTTKETSVELELGTSGTHKVCVVVTDTNGNSDEDCKCITVQELDGPTAVIEGLNSTLKVGCPIALSGANSQSFSDSGTIQSYAWTLDGATVATTVDYSIPGGLTAGSHEICLSVTDSNHEQTQNCITKSVELHVNPTAVLNVSHTNIDVADGGELYYNDALSLTCVGSHDDCPEGQRSIPFEGNTSTGTCDFNGQSWQSNDASCQTLPTQGVDYNFTTGATNPAEYFYKPNCRLTGEVNQVSSTVGAVSVDMCGAQNFNCVRFWVDVTDKFGGTARATKTFKVIVQP